MAEAVFIDASPQSDPPRMADLTSAAPLQPTRSQAVLSLTRDGLSVASHDTNLVLNISRDTFADAPLEQPKQDANRPIEHIHYHGGSGALESVLGLVAIVLVAILGLITLSWIADSLNRSPQVEVSRDV